MKTTMRLNSDTKLSVSGRNRLSSFQSDICHTIVDRMEQGVIVFDRQNILYANDNVFDILSIPEELLAPGSSLEEFIKFGVKRGDYYPNSELTFASIRMRLMAGEDFVLLRKTPNGRFYRINSRFRDGVGISTYTDITNESREKAVLTNTVEAIAQGLLVHDREKIVISNKHLLSVMDLPPEVVEAGTPWKEFIEYRAKRGDYDDPEEHVKKILQAFDSQTGFSSETRAGSKTIRVECRNAHGMMFVTYTDVTDARDREYKLQQKEAEVRLLAETDSLTGLKNRRAFDDILARHFKKRKKKSSKTSKELALILLDLDHFKPVNDTYGHSFGDTLLKQVARRFGKIVRKSDTMARIGGDEFGAIVEVDDKGEAIEIATCMRDAARIPILIEQTKLRVNASVGVSYFSDGFEDAPAMFVGADLALYAAKDDSRGSVYEFEAEFATNAIQKYLLEQDLLSALDKNEFVLHYQVQQDLSSGKVAGYEALMRWHHPVKGLISPADFIPLAEETGFIVEMGRWALKQAARDFGGKDKSTRVAVNVSPVQFRESNLIEDIKQALEESDLAPEQLEIEITEDVLIEDNVNTLKILKGIRQIGVGLSLDDFGAGYSSLSYLTRYPFSKLKIDRYFIDQMIRDERSQSLVKSILSLASNMGMKVTAEGVETSEQLDLLVKSNCDEVQGYLLGKPQPLDEIKKTAVL
ncbi:EAL domain-containing protein [Ahrensia marina]|uniref:EAL domain-containing protein n=1 Tax=Ahrensia marina TaxID=1514904 RepID=UPI0006B5C14F|nr:EAL domain-containing protein [Ahrensia marina]